VHQEQLRKYQNFKEFTKALDPSEVDIRRSLTKLKNFSLLSAFPSKNKFGDLQTSQEIYFGKKLVKKTNKLGENTRSFDSRNGKFIVYRRFE
jgi:hypothetical protein